MSTLLSYAKVGALILSTLALYTLWLTGRLFVGRAPRWRRFIYRVWARIFARLLRIRVTVVGTPPVPPFFLVANHVGYVDIPAVRSAVEGVFVAKSEISGWPVVGTIIGDMGTIYINRASRRDIPRAGAEILESFDRGEGVIVFPEGTSSDGRQILPFNSSFMEFAAKAGIPVHHVTIHYKTGEGHPPASTAVAWADETPLHRHMARLFGMKGFDAVLTFGAESVSSSDRKELSRMLEEAVRENFRPLD
jgi:1-acyl-sn-glycerol-3-phosphate acyltransferase